MLILDKLTGLRALPTIRRLLRDSAGATAIEYGFLALLLAIPVAACLPPIASTVKAHYMKTADGFDAHAKAEAEAKAKKAP
jgi:Flp pilus assembly pilin Flp